MESTYTISRMIKEEKKFKMHGITPYATDVTFKKGFRPSDAIEEGKIFYKVKHKLYDYKGEMPVFPIGLAI